MVDNTDARLSEFNEMAFKMARINKLQERINNFWQNPKGVWFNPEVEIGGAEYGWVLIFSALRSLYMEARPKCKADEREHADKYVKILQDYIDDEKVITTVKDHGQIRKEVDKQQWTLLRNNLQSFESLVRDLLDIHGFSPDIDDGGLF